jgi:hypothetical protein
MAFKSKVRAWQNATNGREKNAFLGGLSTMQSLGLLGLDSVAGGTLSNPLSTFSYQLNRSLNNGVSGTLDRVQADEVIAKTLVSRAGDSIADLASKLVGDVAKNTKKSLVDDPKRAAIFEQLRRSDEIIASADRNSLLQAYDSMAKFAPTLSTNISAAKSFLREAAQHDGGIDYMTIKGLGQAERAVTGKPMGGE